MWAQLETLLLAEDIITECNEARLVIEKAQDFRQIHLSGSLTRQLSPQCFIDLFLIYILQSYVAVHLSVACFHLFLSKKGLTGATLV